MLKSQLNVKSANCLFCLIDYVTVITNDIIFIITIDYVTVITNGIIFIITIDYVTVITNDIIFIITIDYVTVITNSIIFIKTVLLLFAGTQGPAGGDRSRAGAQASFCGPDLHT